MNEITISIDLFFEIQEYFERHMDVDYEDGQYRPNEEAKMLYSLEQAYLKNDE